MDSLKYFHWDIFSETFRYELVQAYDTKDASFAG